MMRVSANGASIPALGFGTYGMKGRELEISLAAAFDSGWRHVDTAQVYGNEDVVGAAVTKAGIARADVFLTTKVWVTNYGSEAFDASVDDSLRRLGTDYVDLLLLHWPGSPVPLSEQIEGLTRVARAGKARHIGVSNFNVAQVLDAARLSSLPIVTNQVEYHPYLNQGALISGLRKTGVAITAYCPMAIGRVMQDSVLKEIAASKQRSVAQIVLRWVVHQNMIALSRSAHPDRVRDNAKIDDFTLSLVEMEAITQLAAPDSRIVSPPGLAPSWDPTPGRSAREA